MIRIHRRWFPRAFLSLVILAGACSWGVGEGSQNAEEMHRHLSKTIDIQSSVVQGNLGRAREAANWILTREELNPFPAGTESYRQELMAFAARIAEARDLNTVAANTGRLAASCGGCHQALKAGPQFVVGTDKPGGESQGAIMVRHIWAADRMWEGLVGPSEGAWMAGAKAMAETEPALAEALRAAASPERADGLLREVNVLATEGLNAYDQGQRADVYGRLLGTCVRCHTSMELP